MPQAFKLRPNLFLLPIANQADSRAALQKELPQLTAWLHAQGKAFRVRVAVDVDPLWLE